MLDSVVTHLSRDKKWTVSTQGRVDQVEGTSHIANPLVSRLALLLSP